jgi:lipid-A-disaccharide synthase
MLKASCLIAQKIKEIQFIIAKSPQVDLGIYARLINGVSGINVKIIEGKTYDSLSSADFCLVASGTATLETAIIGKPFLVVYKMGLLNYLLYRPQIKVPYIGMVNIVAGRKVIPEFIQFEARPERISEQVLKILLEPLLMEEMKSNLLEVRSRLGEKGATARAAKIIVDFNRDVPQRDTLLEKRYCNLFIYKRLLF